jgi:hypothetical protein
MSEIDVVKIGVVALADVMTKLNKELSDNVVALAGAKTTMKDYNDQIKATEKEVQNLEQSETADTATLNAKKEVLAQLKVAREEQSLQVKAITTAVNESNKMVQQANILDTEKIGSQKALKAELFLTDKAINSLTTAEIENTVQGKALIENSKNLTVELKKNEEATDKFQRNVGNYPKLVNLANASLGDMKKELQMLRKESFVGKAPQEIADIKQRMGDLIDVMGDLRSEMKVMGGPGIGAIVSGLKGVTAGVEGVVASLNIMGVENEVVKDLSDKMTSLIGVTQALSEWEDLINSGKAKAIVLKIKDIALTTASTVAKWAEVVATNAAAGAQWLLNVAMSMNPIGLIVIAVALLIAGFWLLVETVGSVVGALEWLINPVGKLIGLIREDTEASKANALEKERQIEIAKAEVKAKENQIEATKKVIKSMEDQLETMKAQGASEKELFKQSQLIHDQKIKLAKEEADLAESNFKLSMRQGGLILANAQAYIDAKNKQNEAQKAKDKEIKDKNDAEIKEAREKARKNAEDAEADRKKAREESIKNEKDYKQRIADLSVEIMEQGKARELKALQIAHERELAEIKGNGEQAILLKAGLETQYQEEKKRIEKAYKDAEKAKVVDDEIEKQRLKINELDKNSVEYYDAQIAFMEIQKQKELEGVKVGSQKEANIKTKWKQEVDNFEIGLTQEASKRDAESNAQTVANAEATANTKKQLTQDAVTTAMGFMDMFDKTGKASALTQVAYDTAGAISGLVKASNANPTNGVTFGVAGIIQYAMGALKIAMNIKKAIGIINSKKPETGGISSGGGGGSASSASASAQSVGASVSADFYAKYSQTAGTANNNTAGSNQSVQGMAFASALKGVTLQVGVTDIQNGLQNAQVRDNRISS